MKNSNDTIGNRIRDLPASSTVPQPAAPPRTSLIPYSFVAIYLLFGRNYCLLPHGGRGSVIVRFLGVPGSDTDPNTASSECFYCSYLQLLQANAWDSSQKN
jgi:hypothetical protein